MFDELEPRVPVAEAMASLRAALDLVALADWDELDAGSAGLVIAELEIEARRLDAAKSDVVVAVDRGQLFRADGHASAKVMVRHCAQLSAAEAGNRAGVATVMVELSEIAAAYRAGRVGTPQLRRLARVWRNPRVRDQVRLCELTFLRCAIELEYVDFDSMLAQWERLVDHDGPAPRGSERRHVRLAADHDGNWHLRAVLGAVEGAHVKEILDHFTAAERLADVEAAKAVHGERFAEHLDRSVDQQRADALYRIFALAAGAPPGSSAAKVTFDVVIDHRSFEAILARLAGDDDAEAVDPLDDRYRCSTLDGTPIDPHQAVAAALVGHLRRVVYDSAGTVIDLGRRARLFTGSARDAVKLQARRCDWPGCWVKVEACEIDHLCAHTDGGRTDPGNGAPCCGRHNRLKHTGYHIWRDPADGLWHLTRPDGTEAPTHLVHDPWAA